MRYLSVMAFWTCMLRCSDGSYYVGHTDNLEVRIASTIQAISAATPSAFARSNWCGANIFKPVTKRFPLNGRSRVGAG